MTKKERMAYLAGAIDSDGTIGVKRSTYAMRIRGDAGQAVYSERVALRQVDEVIPKMLRDAFGGSLYVTKPSCRGGRPLWSWSATDLKAVACIRAVLPYLTVKKMQAVNCLRLRGFKERSRKGRVPKGRGHVGAIRRPQDLTDKMEACYLDAKYLNRVGLKGGDAGASDPC